jgi:hypothetical protein
MWKKLKSKESSSSSQMPRTSWNPRAEFNHYLEMDHVSHDQRLQEEDDQIDLLGWWRDNERQFPVLSQFARDVLLVPVSTVSYESTFSIVGRIIEDPLLPRRLRHSHASKIGRQQMHDNNIN